MSLMSFLFLFGPGALTLLVASSVHPRPSRGAIHSLAQWVAYTYLDLGGLALLKRLQGGEASNGLLPAQNGEGLLTTLAVGLLVGALLGVLGKLQVRLVVEKRGRSLWEKLTPKRKRLIKRLSLLGLMALFLGWAIYPPVKQALEQRREENYRALARSVFQGTQKALLEKGEEKDPKAYGSLWVEGIEVKQVEKDQYFAKTGSGKGRTDAVYMVDGEGRLVYFSIRDKTHGSTWSGPSQDESFLESHEGWNAGAGWGWNGVKVEE